MSLSSRLLHWLGITGIGLLCYFQWKMSWLESISVSFASFCILNFLTQLGQRIVILETIMLLAAVQWLLSAVITFAVFNQYHDLAFLWKTFMTVPSDAYFGFVLPGTFMLFLGLTFPVNWHPIPGHREVVTKAQTYLQNKGHIGIWLSGIGVLVFFLVPYLPILVRGMVAFFSQLLYVGVFYVLFSPNLKYKSLLLAFVLSVMLLNAAMTGMYGEIIFWGILYIMMYFMQYKVSWRMKIMIFALGFYVVLLIQSIKKEYRDATWDTGMVRRSDFGLFGSLIADRIANPQKMTDLESFYEISSRANQGLIISSAMNYVPKREPFANGETIGSSVVAAFVPRIIWPDKPMAGGKENVQRFLGAEDVEYSFNLSPIGEAYVNFGKPGAVFYMFAYGLFFNAVFRYCLSLSSRYPSILAWMPLLFSGSLGVETDVLTTMGSLVKAAMFTWFMFWFCRNFFRVHL